ncbi:hypothetical protein GGX14DRAFT_546026 [Mycena pura]|uniref:Uncharacterized protein n=1 Tax=Mycena pura TaxID=153505 RepID=A0AAD6UU36_9AGAR|nr:hypothetical protein GGX14DRAFT_546026 [Mycena pura]
MPLIPSLRAFLRTLFPVKETLPPGMDVNYGIPGVILASETNERIATWAAGIFSPLAIDIKRLSDLQQCEIVELYHYRMEGSIAHELVVVHIRSRGDVRFGRLERFKELGVVNGTSSYVPQPSPRNKNLNAGIFIRDTAQRKKREVTGKDTGNHDHVWISDKLDALKLDNYQLVQSAPIPPGTMNILHCAALAVTLADEAKDYSLFHHMCMWWAASFFKATCLFAGILPSSVHRGPAIDRAGKILGVPFVDTDGVLVFAPDNLASLEDMLRRIDDEQLKIALREDFPKLNKLRATRIDQIHLRFKAKELAVRTALETAVAALLDREHREYRLATELETMTKEREASEREREAAEWDRKAAERDREAAERGREVAEREREAAQREREAAQRDREAAEKKCQELQARLDELERAARIE